MTLKEFISDENLAKENPFENCNVIEKITYSDYVQMTKYIAAGVFDEETGKYRPLSRILITRIAELGVILGLEDLDGCNNAEDVDELFNKVVCSDLYDKFRKKIVSKIAPGFNAVESGMNRFIDYKLELMSKADGSEEKILNTLIALLSSESFANLLEQIPVDDVEKVADMDEVHS